MPKLTEDEGAKLVSMFDELELKPDISDPAALTKWMAKYVKAKTKDPKQPGGADGGAGGAAAEVHHQHYRLPPRIANFSGSGDSKEITYEAWKYEVKSYISEETYSVAEVTAAARKSLRGEASATARRLGVDANLDHLLNKSMDPWKMQVNF